MPRTKNYHTGAVFFPDKLRRQFELLPRFPCTVVEAPMGYGKTTAVRKFLEKLNAATVLWQTVYEAGGDDFWLGLCASFSKLDAALADRMRSAGLFIDSPMRRELLQTLQEFSLDRETFLVIDDYHLVQSCDADHFLARLIPCLPKRMHLIVVTRNSFLDSAPDLWLKSLIHRIGQDAFSFSPEDICAYYKLCGINITSQEQQMLYARSEGWVSALYLMMLEYINTGVFTTSRDIPALVRQAIYKPLPDELKDFLVHVCIFDTFTLEQAQYLWPKGNSAALLQQLCTNNTFISHHAQTGSYHLHNIFSFCVRDAFSCLPEAEQKEIWNRAGCWFTRNSEYVNAMDCFYQAGDFENLLLAFEKDRSYSTIGQYPDKMILYLSSCPREIRCRHHYAVLIYARLLYMANQGPLFQQTCTELRQEIMEDDSIEESERNTYLGELQLVLGISKYNSIPEMSSYFYEAANLLKSPSTILNSLANWTMGAPSILYMFYRESGTLDHEILLMNHGLFCYSRATGGHGFGAATIFEAEINFMRGKMDQAEISIHSVVSKVEKSKQWSILLCAMWLHAQIAVFQDDYPQSERILKRAQEMIQRQNRFVLLYTLDLCQAYQFALLGQPEKAPQWVLEGDLSGIKMLFTVVPAFQMVYSRILLEQKQYLKLIGLSEEFFKTAGVFPNLLCILYLHIHLAAAYDSLLRRPEALESLKQALDLAMPDKLYWPFVENGERIGSLLWESGQFREYREEIQCIRALYVQYHQSVNHIKAEFFDAPNQSLSHREMEVAALAARGLSNREISDRLFISENTVKAHLKSIFEKLSIKSRAQLEAYFRQKT